MRAYLLKEEFQHFWSYTSVWGGRRFLKEWTTMALRSRIKAIQKFARTHRAHEPLLLNWFARKQYKRPPVVRKHGRAAREPPYRVLAQHRIPPFMYSERRLSGDSPASAVAERRRSDVPLLLAEKGRSSALS
jgi:hypothetical protein